MYVCRRNVQCLCSAPSMSSSCHNCLQPFATKGVPGSNRVALGGIKDCQRLSPHSLSATEVTTHHDLVKNDGLDAPHSVLAVLHLTGWQHLVGHAIVQGPLQHRRRLNRAGCGWALDRLMRERRRLTGGGGRGEFIGTGLCKKEGTEKQGHFQNSGGHHLCRCVNQCWRP